MASRCHNSSAMPCQAAHPLAAFCSALRPALPPPEDRGERHLPPPPSAPSALCRSHRPTRCLGAHPLASSCSALWRRGGGQHVP